MTILRELEGKQKIQLPKGVWWFGFPTYGISATRSSLPRNGGSCSLCCVSLWPPPGSCVRPWPPPGSCVHPWPPPGPWQWPPGFCVWSWPPPLGTQMSSFSYAFGPLKIFRRLCIGRQNITIAKDFNEQFLGIKGSGQWEGRGFGSSSNH